MPFLGIDVGGANLKVATENGDFRLIYLPVWKRLDELEAKLREIKEEFEPDGVGVVMTAELSDAFPTKTFGVRRIAEIVEGVFRNVLFLDLEGRLRGYGDVLKEPRTFMASNWVASVRFLLEEGWRNFVFADMGSTTTDLIPVTDRVEAGKTDYERLGRGELLYFGVLRTPVFYILPEFDVPLVSEFFAVAGDVFVVTGDLDPREYTCDTPDGRGKDVESCMRRLARCVCCDLEEVGEDYVYSMARAFRERVLEKLERAVRDLSDRFGLERVVGCGLGEFLLREATERVGMEFLSVKEIYGDVSKVFPAYAMARLVLKHPPKR